MAKQRKRDLLHKQFEAKCSTAFKAVKINWMAESSLYWSLDMAFRENECRIRRDNGAEFFAVMRRLAINVIKKDTSKKAGIRRKQRMAAMNPDYATHLLSHFQEI